MRVLEKGIGGFEVICTGKGNGNCGCKAKLLLSIGDIFKCSSSALWDIDYYYSFCCPECGTMTDLDSVPQSFRDYADDYYRKYGSTGKLMMVKELGERIANNSLNLYKAKENILKQLKDYVPENERETQIRDAIIYFINNNERFLTRDNPNGHLTASAFILDNNHENVLMVNHNIYNGYAIPGGHVDDDTDLTYTAIREVFEETGLKPRALIDGFIDLSIDNIPSHIKNGKEVLPHLHYNAIVLGTADSRIQLINRPQENSNAMWMPLQESVSDKVVPFVRESNERILTKLHNKKII